MIKVLTFAGNESPVSLYVDGLVLADEIGVTVFVGM